MNSISCTNDEYLVENKSQYLISFKKYLIMPIVAGFNGFCIIFSLVLVLKLLSFLLSSNAVFNLDLLDLMYGLTGFTLTFLVDFLKKLH
jgi:hypothetical protein